MDMSDSDGPNLNARTHVSSILKRSGVVSNSGPNENERKKLREGKIGELSGFGSNSGPKEFEVHPFDVEEDDPEYWSQRVDFLESLHNFQILTQRIHEDDENDNVDEDEGGNEGEKGAVPEGRETENEFSDFEETESEKEVSEDEEIGRAHV